MKKRNRKKDIGLIVSAVLAAALLGVFAFALCKLIMERMETKRATEGFSELSALVGTREPVAATPECTPIRTDAPTAAPSPDPFATPTPLPTPTPEPTVQPRLAALYETNGDLFGWITIPGTRVDHPIMYTPESPWFYLYRDFYGGESLVGVPFLEESCKPDDAVLLIYGHHRYDGTVFTDLDLFRKRSFWEENPYILLDTLTEQRTYIVFAAVETKTYAASRKNVFRYEALDVNTPEAFAAYIAELRARALYDTEIPVEWGDEVLLLSTCIFRNTEGRFVIAAKRIDGAGE